jgi:hypothetical protein
VIAYDVLFALAFAAVSVASRFALAHLTGDPLDRKSAFRTLLVFPAAAVLLVWSSSQWFMATSSEGGWFAGFPAGIFWMAAWLLVDSAGLAIMIMVSIRVLGMRPAALGSWSLRTLGLALLVALPGLAVVFGLQRLHSGTG